MKQGNLQHQIVNIDLNFLKTLIHPQRIEIYGSSNVGTTAFSLYISKKFNEAGLTTLFVDISRRLTKQYLLQNGFDDYLALAPATTTAQIYEIFDKCRDSADLIIFDDIAGISTSKQHQHMHKELIYRLNNYLNREAINNTLIYVNQIRIDPITERVYVPYGHFADIDMRIKLQKLETRTGYRIIQGKIEKNNFGKEDYFSFKLYQDRLEGNVKS